MRTTGIRTSRDRTSGGPPVLFSFKEGLFTAELNNGVMQPPSKNFFASFVHGKIHVKFKKNLRELAKDGIKFEIQARFFLVHMT